MTARKPYLVVAGAAALPRLAVLVVERGDILASFTEKSDDFARTFVESGTYGFVPAVPSAYTQPLYGFFLVPVYAVERAWWSVGVAQTLLAVATALLVYELGRRVVSPRAALVAALLATWSPYLVWHDVHVNREIVDQPVAVALVLLAVVAAERRSWPFAAASGAAAGVAVLGNARLLGIPIVLAAFLLWRRAGALTAASAIAASALVVAPWVVRNEVQVGCAAITTDARALWKANNEQTDEVLASGRWIDEVEGPPGAPPTPEDAAATYRDQGRVVAVDECAQMRYYRGLASDFWREHPGEKAELAARGAVMLWDPRTTQTEGRPGAGTWLDTAREWVAPAYVVPLFVLALLGLRRLPRPFLVLTAALLAYGTIAAMLFVGATRYRAPWDFLLAVPAAATLDWLLARRRSS